MTARERLILAAGVAIALGGILATCAGYGLYYRSDAYRRYVERELTAFFSLPVEIGRIEPHTLHSRVFRDIRLWLPDRRDRVCTFAQAIWAEQNAETGPDICLDLANGSISLGSSQWEREDYWRVLRAAFTKNLAAVNLKQVRLHGMDLRWHRPQMPLTAEDVTGRIDFDASHRGEATLVAASLNGHRVAEPIHIIARLDPAADQFLPEVRLTVPPLPLATLRLDALIGGELRHGRFQGTVVYRQRGDVEDLELAGQAEDLQLRELTARVPFGPLDGRMSVRIDAADVQVLPARRLRSIRFGGRIEDLALRPLLARAGYANLGGRATLTLDDVLLGPDGIRQLLARGEVESVPLEALTRQLGAGVVRGDLHAQLGSLQILENRLAAMTADVDVIAPKSGGPATIDRSLLLGVLRQSLGLAIPDSVASMLPEQIEYTQLGAKLFVKDAQLRILGPPATDHESIATLRLLGQEVRIPPPRRPIPLEAVGELVQQRAREVDFDRLRRWWSTTEPATRPAAD